MEKCGFIAILGAPNAGKSTLVNQLVGQKVSIVSPKVQTTRSRIMGIAIQDNCQLILIDTPGIFEGKKKLDHAMVKEAFDASADSDAIVLVIDVTKPNLKLAQQLCEQHKKGLIVCLNKIDLIEKENLLKLTSSISTFKNIKETFMVSALHNDGVKDLAKYLCNALPDGPWLFPEDQITNIPMRSWATEVTREQIFLTLHQEIPYNIFVESESWEEFENGSVKISQAIVVAKNNYKGIVLGKGGQTLKKIGQTARHELESQLERRVHLKLFVKVEEDWQEKSWALRAFGINA